MQGKDARLVGVEYLGSRTADLSAKEREETLVL